MSNSPLISGTLLTQNCSCPRNHAIDTITPHYMAWFTDARTCCESFLPSSRQASSNYCIGKDGEIWLNVEEKNRAWTSGSSGNDNRAVTIECANYMDASRYGVLPDSTWSSLVRLCADICRRNGKSRLVYVGAANYSGLQEDEMLLTMHQWFQDTDCPGPWLELQFDRLSEEVNELLGSEPRNNANGGKLDVDGWGGYNTILDMQHFLGTVEDGHISGQYAPYHKYFWAFTSCVDFSMGGSLMVRALQERIGMKPTGYWDADTSGSLQEWLIEKGYECGPCGVDQYFGNDSVKALQRCMNDHRL